MWQEMVDRSVTDVEVSQTVSGVLLEVDHATA